jgi:uncharacterized phage protein (TIGR02220 family)
VHRFWVLSFLKALLMVKLTKRKGFNFFRSYFDVYNELETNEDKVAFMDALLERQFMGIKPTELKGMAKFAYISQTNSIDSQVKGYEDKTGITLHPTQGGCVGVITPPALQVEVKEKEQVEVKEQEPINWQSLLDFLNNTLNKKYKVFPETVKKSYRTRLKEGFTKANIMNAITNASKDQFHIDNKYKHLTIEFFSRADKLDKFSQLEDINTSGTTNQKAMKYDN